MNTMTAELTIAHTDTAESQKIARGKAAKAAWKAWLKAGNEPSATQMAIYALLRGKAMNKTFSPITNPNKLANGHAPWYGRNQALAQAGCLLHADWAPFAGMLDTAQSEPVRWKAGQFSYVAASHPLLEEFVQQAKAAAQETGA